MKIQLKEISIMEVANGYKILDEPDLMLYMGIGI
jgi:hypothetical protein